MSTLAPLGVMPDYPYAVHDRNGRIIHPGLTTSSAAAASIPEDAYRCSPTRQPYRSPPTPAGSVAPLVATSHRHHRSIALLARGNRLLIGLASDKAAPGLSRRRVERPSDLVRNGLRSAHRDDHRKRPEVAPQINAVHAEILSLALAPHDRRRERPR